MTSLGTIEQFEVYLATEKRYSEHTLIAYENDLQQFVSYAELTEDRQLTEVNHQLVRGWMVELLERSTVPRSVSRKLSCLRSFFNCLKREGRVTENPMLKIRGPKVEKRLPQFVKQSEFAIGTHLIRFSRLTSTVFVIV